MITKLILIYVYSSLLPLCKSDMNESDSTTTTEPSSHMVQYLHDLEEDVERLGEDITDKIAKEFPEALTENIDVNITIEKQFCKKFLIEEQVHTNETEEPETINKTAQIQTEMVIIRDMLIDYGNYLEKSGKRALKQFAYKIKNLVNPILYLNRILKESIYAREINKYFVFIFSKNITCEMDHQFVLFDMMESSFQIFGKACEETSKLIIRESNTTSSFDDNSIIYAEIGQAEYEFRKKAFKTICETTYICRRFPSFLDHIAKLLKLITELHDRNLLILANVIEDSIISKATFFSSIMDKNIAMDILLYLGSMIDHAGKITTFMNSIKQHILQRFKVYHTNGVEMRNTTKAIRILIDIIDMTHEVNPKDLVASEFHELGKVLSDWGRGKKRNMEDMLSEFFDKTVDFFDVYWTEDIKEEVKVLIGFIVTGTTNNEQLLKDLFTKGSVYATEDHVIYSNPNSVILDNALESLSFSTK